jgi:hypothetical protein
VEEEIVAQMGLILTQLRFARRALEQVEQSTSRYGGVTFATALAAGPRFGEPPLLDGALKVYVVNINDLAPGSGLGGLLEGLLGGVGRFFGGLFGGLVGGTISGVAFPYTFAQMARIAETIERIMDRAGIRGGTPSAPATGATAGAGADLSASLPRIIEGVNALTALFQAASSGPDAAARTSSAPQTAAGQQWLVILQAVQGVLRDVSHVVDGLILLLPILIGAFASFLTRLDDIKLAIVEMLQFILREVLILRGVALVTIFDTIAAAARLGASILAILATAVDQILAAIFRVIGQLLVTAMEVIRFVATGLQRTIDALMDWLVNGLGRFLVFLGDLRIFRLLVHLVQVLPALLPAIYRLQTITEANPSGSSLPQAELDALTIAAGRTIAPPTFPGTGGGSGAIPGFPNLGATIATPADQARLEGSFRDLGSSIRTETRSVFGAATGALTGIGQTLNDSVARGEERFYSQVDAHLGPVREHAGRLADALGAARDAAAASPQTGLEAIARAYEGWLSGGGLDGVLARITEHFRHTPTTGAGAAGSLPGRIVESAPSERPRATVAIQEVVIEVEPPAEPTPTDTPPLGPSGGVDVQELMQQLFDLQERGFRPAHATPLAFG